MKKYDSKLDTIKHIERVKELLFNSIEEISKRAKNHDKTKLENPEKDGFDIYIPKLKEITYGSDEYKNCLKDLGKVLDHHYKHNSHHPEHYKNGIDDMDIFDIIEMLFDWKAASERHKDGNVFKSIKQNKKRFNISSQLVKIFENTLCNMKIKK